MYAQIEKPKGSKSRAVANSVAQKKSDGKQGFGFVDNRHETVAQATLWDIQKKEKKGSLVTQFRLDDDDLEAFVDLPHDQLEELELDDEEREQLGKYRAKLKRLEEQKDEWAAALESRRGGKMISWDYGKETYHVNLGGGGTYHVTLEGSPKKHYFFEGFGEDIVSKQPMKDERGNHSYVFSKLPEKIRTFVKSNFLKLLS